MKINKVKYGIIPAAGAGRRTGYLGTLLPKALFPVYDRPVIHHVVSHMEKLGIKEVFIMVQTQKEKIIDYFENIKGTFKIKINFIEVGTGTSGLVDTILEGEKYVGKNAFMVILGDDCSITPSFNNLLKIFYKNKAQVVEGVVVETDKGLLKDACCVEINPTTYKMIDIIEKPKDPKYPYRGCGVYIFGEDSFKFLKNTPISPLTGYRGITDAVGLIAKKGKGYGVLIDGHNINVNNCDELLRASLLMKKNDSKKN